MRQSSSCCVQPLRRVARHLVDLLADLVDVGQVLRVGVLAARRLGLAVRLDRAIVDAVGELAQPLGARLPTASRSTCSIGGAHVHQPLDAALAQPRRGHRPDAPQRVDRQLLQKPLDPLRRDHRQAVGLLPRRRRSSRGTCSARRPPTRSVPSPRGSPPSAAARPPCPSGSPHAFSVTSRYASSSDSGSTSGVTERKISNTAVDAVAVLLEVGPDDDQVRAEPHRARHRDRRAHAEHARLVARRRDDAALVAGRRRRRPACRAAPDCRAAPRTRRTRPCRRGGCGGSVDPARARQLICAAFRDCQTRQKSADG